MLDDIYQYIDEHFDEHVEKIREFIRQPTISPTDEGIAEGAKMMLGYIKEVADKAELVYQVSDGNPIVYGHLDSKDPNAKTLIFHSMYDVMPITEPELWVTQPFGASIIEVNKLGLPSRFEKVLVGRGARNQKGPTLAHLNAILSILKVTGDVPLNFIFIIEGEEERGSFPSLKPFVMEHLSELEKADAVYYPRMDEDEEGNVVIKLGRRGNFSYFLEVQGGEWGGPTEKDLFDVLIAWVDAPADRLINALSTIKNEKGEILIEGFYDTVRPLNQEEKELLNKIEGSFDEERWKKNCAVRKFKDGLEKKHWERMLMTPTLNFEGVNFGFWGKPYRIGERLFERTYSKLPFKVKARICVRAVPDMDPADLKVKIRRHLDKHGYPEVTVSRKTLSSNEPGESLPWRISVKEKIAQAAIRTAEKHNRKVIVHPSAEYSSGLHLFTRSPLNLPGIGFGLGYGNNVHSQNEFIWYEGIRECEKGMVTFFHEYAKI